MSNTIEKFEIIVYGATPSGIAAAISAARLKKRTLLVSKFHHVGGLMASGLSCTDVRFLNAHGGVFKEFTQQVLLYYQSVYGPDSQQVTDCNGGIWFEPHVAERVFEGMLGKESLLTVWKNHLLIAAEVDRDVLSMLSLLNEEQGISVNVCGERFIDATYEGDLAAMAGVDYRIGRESRETYHEPYAGHIFLKNPGMDVLDGSTGEGDCLIQAYNFRLTLTNVPENRIAFTKPSDYDRQRYLTLLDVANAKQINDIEDVIRLSPIPNGKYNGNNRPNVLSLDLPLVNARYPEADESERRKIVEEYKSYTLGLLYFLQNDEELPVSFLEKNSKWGFCKDEFIANEGLSRELYVREARRIEGLKTFTSLDVFLEPGSERTPIHHDSIAVADYQVDSHIVQRKQAGWPQYEGHVYLRPISKPALVPFGIMVPAKIKSLLVSGAVSATHLGFSVLRMEPVWMSLGQAAATAAWLSLETNLEVEDLPVDHLQIELIKRGQVISFFHDVGVEDRLWELMNVPFEKAKLDHIPKRPEIMTSKGIQFFATKGFFSSYYARPQDPLTRYEAAEWLYRYAELASLNVENEDETIIEVIDLPKGNEFYDKVAYLIRLGIVGYWRNTNGYYGNATLSLGDAVAAITKIHNVAHPNGLELAFHNGVILNKATKNTVCRFPNDTELWRKYITREAFLDMLLDCYAYIKGYMLQQ